MFDTIRNTGLSGSSITAEQILVEGNLNRTWDRFMQGMMDLQEAGYNRAFEAYLSEGAAGAAYVAEQAEEQKTGFFRKIIDAINKVLAWIKEKAIAIFNSLKSVFSGSGKSDAELKAAEDAAVAAGKKLVAWSEVNGVFSKAVSVFNAAVNAAQQVANNVGDIQDSIKKNTEATSGGGYFTTASKAAEDADYNLTLMEDVLAKAEAGELDFAGKVKNLKDAAASVGKWAGSASDFSSRCSQAVKKMEENLGKYGQKNALTSDRKSPEQMRREELEKAKNEREAQSRDAATAASAGQRSDDASSRGHMTAQLQKSMSFVREVAAKISKLISKLDSLKSRVERIWKNAKAQSEAKADAGRAKAEENRKKQEEKETVREGKYQADSFDLFADGNNFGGFLGESDDDFGFSFG